jgi:hypothetical protein
MTEQEKSTVFGQVLAEYLERRGFPADEARMRNLAVSAGLEDPEGFLGRVRGEDMDYAPHRPGSGSAGSQRSRDAATGDGLLFREDHIAKPSGPGCYFGAPDLRIGCLGDLAHRSHLRRWVYTTKQGKLEEEGLACQKPQ